MNTAGIIDDLIRDTAPEGVYGYHDLLSTVRERKFNGVAVSGGPDETTYLIFLDGEPEGAVIAGLIVPSKSQRINRFIGGARGFQGSRVQVARY